jgi:predicted GIY-YIG superfamily endonuclease
MHSTTVCVIPSDESTAGIGSAVCVDDENCSVLSDESTINSIESLDFANLPTGADVEGFGTGEFAPECTDEDDDELYEGAIPTTHYSCHENVIEGSDDLIGTSVLLNKCGTMLVRRDNQLQATRRERNIIERIASKRDIGTVPLIYLEGILFPSIFWCLSNSSDGGVLGSMPTSFFCQNSTRKRFGVASLSDHAKTRLKSIGNTASTDPRYLTFLFDSIANGAIEGSDTRVVLSRGFEESMGPAGMRIRNKDDNLYSDTIDNRQNVHDLCGSQREDEFDLFVTLTCNQREHFGIRNIKRYIDDGDALENYKSYFADHFPSEKPLSLASEREVQKALQEASMNLTVRNWMEVRKILIKYILESDEKPLGSKVRKLFVRDEYQGDAGNLSHLHMIACLEEKYNTEEGKRAIQGIVRGFVDEIVGADEVQAFISEGLLTDMDDYALMKEQARSYLAHRCSERCMRRTGPGVSDVKCRVPDARYISPDINSFCEVSIDTLHSNASVDVMERIGLCLPAADTGGIFVPTREYLRSKRIYAPVRHGEGNITPVVGRLFAATRSTMNIQICTSNGTSRYVVKYLMKVDENNYVSLGANQKESTETIKGEKVFLCNTKVTSSGINEAKKFAASRHKSKNKGRAVACTEMMQLILGFPQVHSNMEFIRIPTVPLGERPGLEREAPSEAFARKSKAPNQDAFSYVVPLVALREEMFSCKANLYRRHTASQIAMLHDQMLSKVLLDRVFIFGVRPPELLFVDRLEWYYRIFRRVKIDTDDGMASLRKILSAHLPMSSFVDGLGYELLIRPAAIPLLKKVLQTNPNRFMTPEGHAKVRKMLMKLVAYYEECGITASKTTNTTGLSKNSFAEWNTLQSTFLDLDDGGVALPIIVYSNVKPCNASKFIIHLLLSMGHFVTERDMWTHASLKDAFVAASLVDSVVEITQQEVDKLLSAWIDDQLRYYPIGAKKMDEYIVSADNILMSALIDGMIPINEMPPVMYTSLVSLTNEKIEKHNLECRACLVDATLKALGAAYDNPGVVFPSRAQLIGATKANQVVWNPVLPKTPRQSLASYSEQQCIQKRGMLHIDTYCAPGTRAAKNLLIAGPPGVGKTHCLGHSIIYSLCKGLNAVTTAVLADRAFMLGGMHIHKLFKLPVRDGGSPHRLAELAVISLQKKPEFFQFLRRLDVMFVDECGQVSAELLSVLDIVIRKIRDSSLFMGGVLLIGTIDQVQLRPINGLPFLLSPYILTTFSLTVLKEYVRCAKCNVLQEMNELARTFPRSKEEFRKVRDRLKYLMSRYCTFVDTWDSPIVTDSVLRIFPRREETASAVRTFLDVKRQNSLASATPFMQAEAEDSMVAMESHSDWKPSSKPVSAFLNTKLNEPQVLNFYEGAIYQFTHNSPGKFNATQLGFLANVPTKEQLSSFEEIEIIVAPAGTKSIDTTNPPTASTPGWSLTTVGVAPMNSLNLWRHGVKARRKQYGLRHHIASTIHSSIGHSVHKIATELAPGKDLWEKAMVVVLISRVSEASDLIFVGDRQNNINAILKGLSLRNQYDDYMNHIVQVMSSNLPAPGSMPYPIDLSVNPFRQKDILIPDDTSGVVYLLVSIYNPSSLYIGMTNHMAKRLKQHNSGMGAKASSDPSKRPWGLMSYVSGFQSNRSMMRTFEIRWQNIVAFVKPPDAFAASDLARRLISRHYSDSSDNLLLVTMGCR